MDADGKMRGRRVARQKGGKRKKKRERRGKNQRGEREREWNGGSSGIGIS